ncbi:MAG TPA: MFS transporter, partial [Candidatus Methylomirabilis sp.]|nr:MFS transporter [Candidatus Methylomirabilis sp.]
MSASPSASDTVLSGARRNLVAGSIGSVLEWYDFAVYGYLAPIVGKLFFPADDPVASLLAAFGVFAIGFTARPVGGLLLGYVGDKHGRKPALIISVVAMGAATLAIGLMPTHATIGAAAPIALVLLRIVEGLSVGGEFTGAIILLGEHAPPEHRGYYAIWPELGCIAGFLLGSGIGALASTLLGAERMLAWGWRIPFLLGAVIAVWGIAFRRQMTESPALEAARRTTTGASSLAALAAHWRIIVRFVGVLFVSGIGFYTMFIYAASYLTEHMHVTTAHALDINTSSLFVMLLTLGPTAAVSDRIGRKPLMIVATTTTVLLAWPLWWLMQQEQLLSIFLG